MLLALVSGGVTGRLEEVNTALLQGGSAAVSLLLTLGGAMCLWSGLLRIADKAGFTRFISRLAAPVMRLLFPGLPPEDEASRSIAMNVAANFLGLGNAATPLGLNAMAHVQERNPDKRCATRDMIVFAVLNTASVQLFPTTVAALRMEAGSPNPMAILPAVWVTAFGAALAALLVARMFSGGRRGR